VQASDLQPARQRTLHHRHDPGEQLGLAPRRAQEGKHAAQQQQQRQKETQGDAQSAPQPAPQSTWLTFPRRHQNASPIEM
jgi:hypothetical protein